MVFARRNEKSVEKRACYTHTKRVGTFTPNVRFSNANFSLAPSRRNERRERARKNEAKRNGERRQRRRACEYSQVFTKICMMSTRVCACVCVRHKSGEKSSISNVRHFVGENAPPRDIITCRAREGTVERVVSLVPTRKQTTPQDMISSPTFFPLARRKDDDLESSEVHDAKARAGNDIGTNSRNAKARKAFTQRRRLETPETIARGFDAREQRRERPQVRAKQPSGLGFSEVREHKSKFFVLHTVAFSNSPSFVSLVSLWVRADNRLNIPSRDITPSRETGGAVHVEHHDRHQRGFFIEKRRNRRNSERMLVRVPSGCARTLDASTRFRFARGMPF